MCGHGYAAFWEENATPLTSSSFFSLFPFSGSFNKRFKNKTLNAHLRDVVESLNAEGYQHAALFSVSERLQVEYKKQQIRNTYFAFFRSPK